MQNLLKATLAYFGVVFAAAFLLGALRVALIVPWIGDAAAVGLEVPVVLCLSWIVAGRVLARWPLLTRARLAMGILAFACLMLAEFALGTLVFGQTPQAFFGALLRPSGLLGLAGQAGFALVPALRSQPRG